MTLPEGAVPPGPLAQQSHLRELLRAQSCSEEEPPTQRPPPRSASCRVGASTTGRKGERAARGLQQGAIQQCRLSTEREQ